MLEEDQVNILLVDDQPGKLLSYQVVLGPLGENLVAATSGSEALACLLNKQFAVVLIDIEMPDMDGFELASTIRAHPRFEKIAIIFVSAVHYGDADTLRGYKMGAVDYVAVPVTPEILRAKVQVFVDLYRKTRALERITNVLEQRVQERTAELVHAIEREKFLAREVDHRAKNALTVVQSLVRLTRAASVEEYVGTIEGRINALARNHTLLSTSQWKGVDLKEIVESELAPYSTNDGGRFSIEGPTVSLAPTVSQNLTLAIHELTTNAAKYGSLSITAGCLIVKFEILAETLVIDWLEKNGPSSSAPKTAGFGTKLISTSMRQLLGGAEFDWSDGGLHCRLTLPLDGKVEISNQSETESPTPSNSTDSNSRLAVLVVEDEPLVAMMMVDVLSEFEFDVVGPFASVGQAIAAVNKTNVDIAVLDVNLRGEMVYPLASRLQDLAVPFIFVTGYAPESVCKEFNGAPILKKPVDKAQLYQTIQRMNGMAPNRLGIH